MLTPRMNRRSLIISQFRVIGTFTRDPKDLTFQGSANLTGRVMLRKLNEVVIKFLAEFLRRLRLRLTHARASDELRIVLHVIMASIYDYKILPAELFQKGNPLFVC